MAESRHGTSSGYCVDRCRCDECRRWNRENQARWRRNHPDGAERGNAYTRAELKALRVLAGRHQEEFERLFDIERALEGLPPVHTAKKGRRFGAEVIAGARIDGCQEGRTDDQ